MLKHNAKIQKHKEYSRKHFDTRVENNLCGLWQQMNGTSFLILDCLLLLTFFQLISSFENFPLVV